MIQAAYDGPTWCYYSRRVPGRLRALVYVLDAGLEEANQGLLGVGDTAESIVDRPSELFLTDGEARRQDVLASGEVVVHG